MPPGGSPPSVVVLCAGFGERMRPLTESLPKPLLPVGDSHALGLISDELRRQGVRAGALNTHHLDSAFSQSIESLPITFEVSHEPSILGVAGGVRRAVEIAGLSAPVVSWNGDILAERPPLRELAQRAGDGVCLLLSPCPALAADPVPTQGSLLPPGRGSVGLTEEGAIARLRGEHFAPEHASADYTGIAAFGARALALLPEKGCLIGDVCLPMLRKKEEVGTLVVPLSWREVGSRPGYMDANLAWLRARGIDRYEGVGSHVDPGVSLVDCIVGAGARVVGAGRLERCVVWPGATARAPLQDCIVTPKYTVPLVDRE